MLSLKELAAKYEPYSCLDEVAYFSSQDLNIDLVGCVREALAAGDGPGNPIDYTAKFVLQHMYHYMEFCTQTKNEQAICDMEQLVCDIHGRYRSFLEPDTLKEYSDLVAFGIRPKPSLDGQIHGAAARACEAHDLDKDRTFDLER